MNTSDIILLLILTSPFIGASITWLLDKLKKGLSPYLGVLTIGLSGIASLLATIMTLSNNWNANGWETTTMVFLPDLPALTFIIKPDGLSLFMALVAAFLGFLIAIFSLEYMKGDTALTRYWFFLQLFIGGMTLLVLAGDLVLVYVGWETVGLCSFGLIAHWYEKPGETGEKCARSGIKAFVLTRIGDIGFLTAIIILYQRTGTLTFTGLQAQGILLDSHTLDLIGILFLLAAFGKSAQIPFIPWLSSPEDVDIDAMQGPTTVSALIHAATMVKAGVYLVSRLYLILPLWDSMLFIRALIIIAGLTALIAALSALTSNDLKRILAYSTVSQLAYMFLGLGVAFLLKNASIALPHESAMSFLTAQFHVLSHAIFKSLLFLTAGYLIHKHNTRRIQDLHGKARYTKDVYAFIGISTGAIALAGLPIPPYIGFFSKEGLLAMSVTHMNKDPLLAFTAYMEIITAFVTVSYVARLCYYLFTSPPETKTHNEHEHENALFMPFIILMLSCLGIFGGFLQLIIPNMFSMLSPDNHLPHETNYQLLLLSACIELFGILVFYLLWKQPAFIHTVTTLPGISVLVTIIAKGFYLEALWQAAWDLLKEFAAFLKLIHTGDLNRIMIGVASVWGLIIITILGG